VASDITVFGSGSNLAITNNGPLSFAIDVLYFDPTPDNAITGIVLGSTTGTVVFAAGCAPGNLPAGNTASPAFTSLFCVSATNSAGDVNRINAGESLNLSATGGTLGTLVENGTIRVGLHVQSVGTSGVSESLITGASVPEPTTLSLMGAGLLALTLVGRKLRRS
jgi:hypothetical protein